MAVETCRHTCGVTRIRGKNTHTWINIGVFIWLSFWAHFLKGQHAVQASALTTCPFYQSVTLETCADCHQAKITRVSRLSWSWLEFFSLVLGFRDLRVEKVLFVQNVLFLGKRRRADALDSLSLLVDSSGKGKKRDISGAAITSRRKKSTAQGSTFKTLTPRFANFNG